MAAIVQPPVQGKALRNWSRFGSGFTLEGSGAKGGAAINCHPSSLSDVTGASETVELNQTEARPVLVSGFSKSLLVSAPRNSDYSIYLDTLYRDGSHLWGTATPFETGTHDWQERRVMLWPTKPVKSVTVYLLLRGHTGEAWFSDVSLRSLAKGESFDGQPFSAPVLRAGQNEGWFVHPFGSAKNEALSISKVGSLGLAVEETGQNGVRQLTIGSPAHEKHGPDLPSRMYSQPLTLYFCVRCDMADPKWWPTIRKAEPVSSYESGSFAPVDAGSNGQMSVYPYAAVTGMRQGKWLAVPPEQGPVVYRLFYDSASKLLCAAFDVAITDANRYNLGKATVNVFTGPCDPRWGLRDAVARYAKRFPDAVTKRVTKEGIWIPFTNPSTLPHPEDFGIAFHEGDNSVATDAKLGISSFRYTEPMSWWMSMDPKVPRTYENAIRIANEDKNGSNIDLRKSAEALFNSGSEDRYEQFNLEFRNEPWGNGAVWVLNPNPALPALHGATKASIDYDLREADQRYRPGSLLSGEYLDSVESWADTRDYAYRSLAFSEYPATFGAEDGRPFIPQWFSTYEITKRMSRDLHRRGRLLMANTVAVNKQYFMPLLDLGGIEVNWQDGGNYTPDSDDIMCRRRTLSFQKPYLLLMNTDFKTWDKARMEKYMQRSMAYGIFPSMFSADAATHAYWESPALYERDRPLFKKYIPIIRTISHAGWEPVTLASASDPHIYVERFGTRYWTVFNSSPVAINSRFSAENFGRSGSFVNLVTGKAVKTTRIGATSVANLSIDSEECVVLELR